MVRSLCIHIYCETGVNLELSTFSESKEAILAPEEKVASDFNSERGDVELPPRCIGRQSSHPSSKNEIRQFSQNCLDKKDRKPNSFEDPVHLENFQHEECKCPCHKKILELNSIHDLELDCEAGISHLNNSLESEVRLQSLPSLTTCFIAPTDIARNSKQKERKKQDKMKTYFTAMKNKITEHGHSKSRSQTTAGISKDGNGKNVKHDYLLPKPDLTFSRSDSESKKTPLAIIDNKNSDSITISQTSPVELACNSEIERKEQIALICESSTSEADLNDRKNVTNVKSNTVSASQPVKLYTKPILKCENLQTECTDENYDPPSVVQNNSLSKEASVKETEPEIKLRKPRETKDCEGEKVDLCNIVRNATGSTGTTVSNTKEPKSEKQPECSGISGNEKDCSALKEKDLKKVCHGEKGGRYSSDKPLNMSEKKSTKGNTEDDMEESSDKYLDHLRQINRTLKEAKVCKVCRDKDANRLFLPCAHLACCSLCSPAVRNCPQCKGSIRGIVSVYFG